VNVQIVKREVLMFVLDVITVILVIQKLSS